eukprot:6187274-Pleurochrysis_carterae.AAC.2
MSCRRPPSAAADKAWRQKGERQRKGERTSTANLLMAKGHSSKEAGRRGGGKLIDSAQAGGAEHAALSAQALPRSHTRAAPPSSRSRIARTARGVFALHDGVVERHAAVGAAEHQVAALRTKKRSPQRKTPYSATHDAKQKRLEQRNGNIDAAIAAT